MKLGYWDDDKATRHTFERPARACTSPYGHLRGRVLAESITNQPATAPLLFDYRDDQNYKFAGLRTDAGQWIIGAVQEGSETLLAVATADPPAANTWYQLDVVIARTGGQ